MIGYEKAATVPLSRREQRAQASGVELAVEEIERLLARRPDATAEEALIMVRGRLQVLGFAL